MEWNAPFARFTTQVLTHRTRSRSNSFPFASETSERHAAAVVHESDEPRYFNRRLVYAVAHEVQRVRRRSVNQKPLVVAAR